MVQVWRGLDGVIEEIEEDGGDIAGYWRLDTDGCSEITDCGELRTCDPDNGVKAWAGNGIVVAGE